MNISELKRRASSSFKDKELGTLTVTQNGQEITLSGQIGLYENHALLIGVKNLPTMLLEREGDQWRVSPSTEIDNNVVTGLTRALGIEFKEADSVAISLTERINQPDADNGQIIAEAYGQGYFPGQRNGKVYFRKMKADGEEGPQENADGQA